LTQQIVIVIVVVVVVVVVVVYICVSHTDSSTGTPPRKKTFKCSIGMIHHVHRRKSNQKPPVNTLSHQIKYTIEVLVVVVVVNSIFSSFIGCIGLLIACMVVVNLSLSTGVDVRTIILSINMSRSRSRSSNHLYKIRKQQPIRNIVSANSNNTKYSVIKFI